MLQLAYRYFFMLLILVACGPNEPIGIGGLSNGNIDNNNNNNNNNNNQVTAITLSLSDSSIDLGETVTFQVITNLNSDVTTESSITSSDGSSISNAVFTPNVSGTFDFTATYNGLTSNVVQLTVQEPEPDVQFQKNVLIEDYTGTWCGYCPRVSYGIELVKEETDKAVIVAIHRYQGADPYNLQEGSALESMINLSGYPTAMLNRTIDWNYPEPNNVFQVVNLATGGEDLGIAMSPTLNGSDVDIDVKVKFSNSYANTPVKLVVYLLEDGLVYPQSNYTSYYGGVDPINDFVHDHVARAVFTNILGDEIPSDQAIPGATYSKTISTSLPSSVSDPEKLSLAAVVVSGNSNIAINSRAAYFGEEQEFQEN
jgi:thiol-disulfide isomerase/thioredoxin